MTTVSSSQEQFPVEQQELISDAPVLEPEGLTGSVEIQVDSQKTRLSWRNHPTPTRRRIIAIRNPNSFPVNSQRSPLRKRPIYLPSPEPKQPRILNAVDLSQYEKVVIYVKKIDPQSTEPPEIILGENNLTSPIELEVNVLNQNWTLGSDRQPNFDDSVEYEDIASAGVVDAGVRTARFHQIEGNYYQNQDGISYPNDSDQEIDPLDVEQEIVVPISSELKAPSERYHHLPIIHRQGNLPNVELRNSVPTSNVTPLPRTVAGAQVLIERIFGTTFLLSNKLSASMIAVKDPEGDKFRKYIHSRESVYLCVPCNMVRRKSKGKFRIPTINLDIGIEASLTDAPPHYCEGAPLGEVIATEIDRRNRREIAAGKVKNCQQVWEEGIANIINISNEYGFPQRGEASIAHYYPTWLSIRCQYNRLKRL